jgi:cell volume regulation protein A
VGTLERSLFITAVLIVLSVFGSKAGSRFGIPALLLFLVIGMGAGAYRPHDFVLIGNTVAQGLGTLALIFILFSGGMDTKLESIRPVVRPALILSTVGVIIATLLVGLFAYFCLNFSLLEGCLLGATIASTDVAAVFTALRSKDVSLKEGIAPLLELESALNDPMAVFLGVALLGLATHQVQSFLHIVPSFFQQMILGAGVGWLLGKGSTFLINRLRLEFEGLYPVLSIGLILLTYSFTQAIGGSGFLAVYVAGIVMGNSQLLHKRSLIHFQEGIAWLMQIAMFLAMGLLVDPRTLWAIAPMGIAVTAFLVLVARPASVFFCLPWSRFSIWEKGMISWAGLRGAVPIILAMLLLDSKLPQAGTIFHLVFFVTFFSVLVQGTTISFAARKLGVAVPFRARPRFPIEFNPSRDLKNSLLEIYIPADSPVIGMSLLGLELPKDLLIVLIQRGGNILVPRGGTQIMEKDTLLIVTEGRSLADIESLLAGANKP